MFEIILLYSVLGTFAGILFGIIPGLHPNHMIIFIPILVSMNLNPSVMVVFIACMALANAISDSIPSILFGVPDAENGLSTLPGHRMVMKGMGKTAVKLVVIGGFFASVLTIVLLPVLFLAIPPVYSIIRPFIYVLLIFVSCLLVMSESQKITALFVFLISGIIGIFSFNLPVDGNFILFPLLGGFFGVSLLLTQKGGTKIPEDNKIGYVSVHGGKRPVFWGWLGGIFSGFLPGVGSSQIASLFSLEKRDEIFLISLGAVTASNIIMSIFSLEFINKARSGAAVIIDQIGYTEASFYVLPFAMLLSLGIVTVLTLVISKNFIDFMKKFDNAVFSKLIVIFICLATFIFSGLFGLCVLCVSTALGIYVIMAGVRRGLMMGVLIIPTIIFFMGVPI